MILNCLHPVPVIPAPSGRRSETVKFVAFETPVELTTVPATEFTPVEWKPTRPPLLEGPNPEAGLHDLFARDGRLWHRLIRYHPAQIPGWSAPVRPEHFVQFAEGVGLSDGHDLGKHFVGTPLARRFAPLLSWQGTDVPLVHRGDPAPGARPSRTTVSHDSEARAALHAMFRDDIALVGDEIFVRLAGPMLVADFRVSSAVDRLTLFPRMFARFACACHPDDRDRLPALLATAGYRSAQAPTRVYGVPDRLPSRSASPDAVGIPRELYGDSDIDLLSCLVPGLIQLALESVAKRPVGREASQGPDVVALKARLAAAVPLAEIGVFGFASLAGRIECLLADVALVRGLPGGDTNKMRFVTAYLSEVALPRLQGEPSTEDAEAMGDLAP